MPDNELVEILEKVVAGFQQICLHANQAREPLSRPRVKASLIVQLELSYRGPSSF